MTAREPVWQRTGLQALRDLDATLAKYAETLQGRSRDVETEALVFQFVLGDEYGDDHRLIASQLRRIASRLADARVDIRVRIRELEEAAS